MNYYMGIDPGKRGSYCIIDRDYKIVELDNFPLVTLKKTEIDVSDLSYRFQRFSFNYNSGPNKMVACLEKVHAMPKQGVSSMFSFGKSYGLILGILSAFIIPYREVTPQAWTKKMLAGMPGTGKDRAYSVARKMFPLWEPMTNVEKDRADSILIASYEIERTKK